MVKHLGNDGVRELARSLLRHLSPEGRNTVAHRIETVLTFHHTLNL